MKNAIHRRAAVCVFGLLAVTPAWASGATGNVEASTLGAPNIARTLWVNGAGANGTFGYVLGLGGRVPDGTPYTLKKTSGVGVDLDVHFYSDLAGSGIVAGTPGTGYVCNRTGPGPSGSPVPDGSGGETGTIVCGDSNFDGHLTTSDQARYAVVTLFTGAHATFALNW